MVQILLPIATRSNTNWAIIGAPTVHETIDEGVASADDNTTQIAASTTGAVCQVDLSTPAVIPAIESDHVIRTRAKVTGTAGTTNIRLILMQRPSFAVVADAIIDISPLVWAAYAYILSTAEASLITDYSQLTMEIRPRSYAAGDVIRCSAAQLDVPDYRETRVTLFKAEVGAKPGTPRLRVTKFAAEVGALNAPAIVPARVTKFGAEVGANVLRINLTKFAAEVGATGMRIPLWMTKFAAEVGAHRIIPTVDIRATRFAAEIGAKPGTPRLRVTKFGAEVGSHRPPTLDIRVTRFAAEIGAHRDVIASDIVAGTLPSPLPNFAQHNWDGECSLESAWLTDVGEAVSGAEERIGAVPKPYRTQNVRLTGLSKKTGPELWANLNRHGQQRLPIPLYCDQSRVTAASSVNTIHCDTTTRRFFAGGWCVIHAWGARSRPANAFYTKILSVTAVSLIVQSPLPQTYPVGSRVYPVMEVLPNLEGSAVFHGDQVCDVVLSTREVSGRSALSATTTALPAGVSTYQGLAIFNVGPDWSATLESRPIRSGEEEGLGLGTVQDLRGDRPRQVHQLNLTSLSRTAAWKVIQFFDYVRGRKRAHWLVAPETLLSVVSATTTQLVVEAFGNFIDFQLFWQAIGIVKRDGAVVVRLIDTYVDNGNGTWTLGFADSGTPLSAVLIRRATSAHKVRLLEDSMREDWSTDEHMTTRLAYIDVLREQTVSIDGLLEPPTQTHFPATIPDIYCWFDASINTWRWQGGGNLNQRIDPTVDNLEAVNPWDDIRAPSGGAFDPWLNGSGAGTGGDSSSLEVSVPILFFPSNPTINKGHPTLQFELGGEGNRMYLQATDRKWWSDVNGFTLVYAIKATNVASAVSHMARFLRVQGVFEWIGPFHPAFEPGGTNVVKFFETDGVVDTTRWINTTPNLTTGEHMTLMVCWKPSTYARIYKNGILVGSAATPAASLPFITARAIRAFQFASVAPPGDAELPETWFLNAFGIYKRALDSAELNGLGLYLQNRYGNFWTLIP